MTASQSLTKKAASPLAKLRHPSLLQNTLPAIGYATLGAAAVGASYLAAPVLGATGIAVVLGSIALPTAMTGVQFASLGGTGIAKSLGGSPASPYIVRLANEAASAVGAPPPANVFLLDKREPNALATGVSSKDATIAVTAGLIEMLSATELKAVLAHEMGHLKNRDVNRNMHIALAAVGLGGLYEAGRYVLDMDSRSSRSSKSKKDKDESGGVAGLGLALMGAGLASQATAHLLRLTTSRQAELRADAAAAEAFGADALITALTKIHERGAGVSDLRGSSSGRKYAFAMISDGEAGPGAHAAPTSSRWWQRATSLLRTHPGLEERVHSLEALVATGEVRR